MCCFAESMSVNRPILQLLGAHSPSLRPTVLRRLFFQSNSADTDTHTDS